MKKRSIFKKLIKFLYRKETIVFVLTYLVFWSWFYQIEARFDGPHSEPEKSAPLSGFVAFFPAAIISSIIVLGLSTRASGWLKPMMELIVIIARSDGSISAREKKTIEKNLNKQLGYLRIKKAIKYFNQLEKRQELSLAKACMVLNEHLATSEITIFLDFLVNVAVSDQYLSAKEESLLKEICDRLKIHSNSLVSILARKNYISENDRQRKTYKKSAYSSLSMAYKVLGLDESTSFSEVKKTYRELAKVYHPDKVRDKVLRQQAKIRFQEITDAYNKIKEKKG